MGRTRNWLYYAPEAYLIFITCFWLIVACAMRLEAEETGRRADASEKCVQATMDLYPAVVDCSKLYEQAP